MAHVCKNHVMLLLAVLTTFSVFPLFSRIGVGSEASSLTSLILQYCSRLHLEAGAGAC